MIVHNPRTIQKFLWSTTMLKPLGYLEKAATTASQRDTVQKETRWIALVRSSKNRQRACEENAK